MSNRFARVTEEVILRRKELAVEHHKTGKLGRSALETLFLYIVILLHSWETGVLDKKKFPKLCEIYELNLKNSYRRLKIMRGKGWIEDTNEYIRPLLTHRSKGVTITPISTAKSVTVTPNFKANGVTVTPEKCNSYTEFGEIGVIVTPENGETSIPISDSGDAKTFLNLKSNLDDNNNREKTDVVVVEKNKFYKSDFSFDECLRYVELCIAKGQTVKNAYGLAVTLHQSGDADAFIQATLYPEPIKAEQTIEYADDEYEMPAPEPMSETARESMLVMLRGMLREATIENLQSLAPMHTPEDWNYLMEELQK